MDSSDGDSQAASDERSGTLMATRAESAGPTQESDGASASPNGSGPAVWAQQQVAETGGLKELEQQSHVPRGPKREPHAPASVSNVGDRIFVWVLNSFAGLIVSTLLIMIGLLAWQSRETISKLGFGFLTSSTWNPITDNYGAVPAVAGTLYTSFLALLVATPVALMVAIFLTELAPRWMRFSLGFVVELLAAVPSIVYGLWALLVLKPLVATYVEPPLIDRFGNLPLFSGYAIGLDIFTASLILSIMILPTIAAISRDVMMAVPNSQRDAMLALGATRWETTWKVVIPLARSGIVGGIILGLGRAVGETMAVQMVIGNREAFSPSLFKAGTTMAATIVNQLTEASGLQRSALIELALFLMLVTVLLNSVARILVWRMGRIGV